MAALEIEVRFDPADGFELGAVGGDEATAAVLFDAEAGAFGFFDVDDVGAHAGVEEAAHVELFFGGGEDGDGLREGFFAPGGEAAFGLGGAGVVVGAAVGIPVEGLCVAVGQVRVVDVFACEPSLLDLRR